MSHAFEIVASFDLEQANRFQMSTIIGAKTVFTTEDEVREFVEEGLRMGEIECEGFDAGVEMVKFIPGACADGRLMVKVYIVSDYQSP